VYSIIVILAEREEFRLTKDEVEKIRVSCLLSAREAIYAKKFATATIELFEIKI
jgi:hypothetical protein